MGESTAKQQVSRRAVIAYTVVLFAIVLFFIGLSYFIDRRGDDAVDALSEQNSSATKKIETLQTENVDMRAELDALYIQLDALETEKAALEESFFEMEKDYDKTRAQLNAILAIRENEKQTEEEEND